MDRSLVELLRRRATRRKLVLLECAIVRHAPFADCGRPIWELLPGQRWFEIALAPVERIRALRRASLAELRTWPDDDPPLQLSPMNGHQAIQWLEQHADGEASDDQLVLAEEYFSHAEYSAEADRFDTPDERRDELEVSYGVADWLLGLMGVSPESSNVVEYYLTYFSGVFDRWGGMRPLHAGHRTVGIDLIQDIFGHPHHSARLDPDWLAWNDGTVPKIAHAVYEGRRFEDMPILADALEDADCSDPTILNHCRSHGRHVRGCWVLDLILGKG